MLDAAWRVEPRRAARWTAPRQLAAGGAYAVRREPGPSRAGGVRALDGSAGCLGRRRRRPSSSSADRCRPAGRARRSTAMAGTGWRAAAGDQDPWLRLRWAEPVTMDRLEAARAASLAAVATRTSRGGPGDGTAGRSRSATTGSVDLRRPLHDREITIRFTACTLAGSVDPYTRAGRPAPGGRERVSLVGARRCRHRRRRWRLPCRVVRARVSGSVDAVLNTAAGHLPGLSCGQTVGSCRLRPRC